MRVVERDLAIECRQQRSIVRQPMNILFDAGNQQVDLMPGQRISQPLSVPRVSSQRGLHECIAPTATDGIVVDIGADQANSRVRRT